MNRSPSDILSRTSFPDHFHKISQILHKDTHLDRRHFLQKSLSAALGIMLPACASRLPDLAHPSMPKPKNAVWIDSHAHIFNAEDIDSYGYINHGLGNTAFKKTALRLFDPLIRSITMSLRFLAPSAERENWLLDEMLAKRPKQKSRRLMDRAETQDRVDFLLQQIDSLDSSPRRKEEELSREFEKELAHCLKGSELPEDDAQKRILREMIGRFRRKIRPSLLSCLANYRIYNALQLIKTYPDVDAFVTTTLDFVSWYLFGPKTRPGESLMLQTQLMAKIAVLTEGKIIPRPGLCPRRQVLWECSDPKRRAPVSPLGVLECSAAHFGAIGAKIYPVLGFRPLGNAELQNSEVAGVAFQKIQRVLKNSHLGAADALKLKEDPYSIGKLLDAALEKMYSTCVKSGLSVMAHTNRSWGPSTEVMNRVAPKYWKAVGEKYRDLRVNLAHFGGFDDGPDAYATGEEKGWPTQMCRDLFSHFPGMYADLGHTEAKDAERVGQHIEKLIEDYPETPKRLLYGSDWHEVMMPSGGRNYFGSWTSLFAHREKMRPHATAFFGGNAAHFFGLKTRNQNRRRLDAFYSTHSVNPQWRIRVDRMT